MCVLGYFDVGCGGSLSIIIYTLPVCKLDLTPKKDLWIQVLTLHVHFRNILQTWNLKLTYFQFVLSYFCYSAMVKIYNVINIKLQFDCISLFLCSKWWQNIADVKVKTLSLINQYSLSWRYSKLQQETGERSLRGNICMIHKAIPKWYALYANTV